MSLTRRALLGAAALCGSNAVGRAAEPPGIAFAAIFPFSGTQALLGDESFRGLALAVDALNAAGGLGKRTVSLIREDGRDPERATAVAKSVIGKVSVIFGTGTTEVALAASAVAGLANLPYFELTAIGNPVTARGLPYLFRFCPDANAFADRSLEGLMKVVAPAVPGGAAGMRVGVLNVASGPSAAIAAGQTAGCKKLRLDLVQTLAYPANTLDFAPLVHALREARVDVLLHAGHTNDVVLLYRAMQQARWRPRFVIGCGAAYGLTDTQQAIGAPFDGTIVVDFPPYATNPKAAHGAAALERAYRTRYGSEPRSGLSLAAYTGATFALRALTHAGSTDREKIRVAVRAMDEPYGAGANGWGVAFAPNGQNKEAAPVILQWQRGQAVAIYPASVAVAPAALAPEPPAAETPR